MKTSIKTVLAAAALAFAVAGTADAALVHYRAGELQQ
jgi:hypothetical protein